MLSKIYNKLRNNKVISYIFFKNIIEDSYTNFIDETISSPFKEWEIDFFASIYFSSQSVDDSFDSYSIVNDYVQTYLLKNNFNIMEVSNDLLFNHRFSLIFYSKEQFANSMKFIQEQNLKTLDSINSRAKKLIVHTANEMYIWKKFRKDFMEDNFQ